MRAGVKAQQRSHHILVIFCRERNRKTQFNYSDRKLPYYHNVNKRNKCGSNAKNLIVVPRVTLKTPDICQKENQLRLCSLNTQSLRNKSADFVYASSIRADIFAVTETWFSDAAYRTEVTTPGFKLIEHCRDGRRGGGTALLVKDSLQVKKIDAG